MNYIALGHDPNTNDNDWIEFSLGSTERNLAGAKTLAQAWAMTRGWNVFVVPSEEPVAQYHP